MKKAMRELSFLLLGVSNRQKGEVVGTNGKGRCDRVRSRQREYYRVNLEKTQIERKWVEDLTSMIS